MTLSYDELEEFRRSLRRFVERELIPFERRVMTEAERRKAQDSAREAGFWLMDVPEALGGQGLGMRGMAVFWHEVSRTTALPARDHSLFGPVTGPILLSLSGQQKERYLDPVLAGRKRACFAQTEPDAGSDPASMRTRAARKGNRYVINGVKRFITHADVADFAQVIAVTDPAKGVRGGISCFLVDMDTPGLRIATQHETMMGDRPCELVFDNVEILEENRVGAEGVGFSVAQSWLNEGRIRHGARACGVAERCLELAVDYVKQRRTFGEPLAERQGVQWILADCFTELHATKLMVRDAAEKVDAGTEARAETLMAKIYGDEMGFRVADRCLQLHGGIGLTTELPIEKFWRDQRSFMITEGPTEVLRTALAKMILRGAA
ncbi:MAG: acyl-CoA dehydrogenase family protein [Rhizobiales bacterium]|nr:acyl-CoA dehydrogenase family protein [Hyphomicrobiales bacterium]OJY47034.1 MAG: acyl-CoA dehydrogenase [Rhizobiales bacterium 64-17]